MHFRRSTRATAAMLIVLAAAACGDSPGTGPQVIAPERDPSLEAERQATHSIQWNATARALVAARRVDPPRASRIYALLAIAQRATLVAAAGEDGSPGASRPLSLGAALVATSANVLRALLPGDVSPISEFERQDLAVLAGAGALGVDISAGEALGRRIAERVLRHAASDGSTATWTGAVPDTPGAWFSSDTPAAPPMLPQWRSVRTWLMQGGAELRPPPPPAFGTPEFETALAEVRRIADTRTTEQLWIAHYWSDAPGSHTPPGHWNRIATILMSRHTLSERQVTRGLALLNMALMDAGIACWDAKYEYWLMRPWQADTGISVPLMKPNFPSYVSGHASFSGAASEYLASLFPADAEDVRAMAEEAAISRLYGGIHYRFDNEQGLELGRRIAQIAIARNGSPDAALPWSRYLR